MSPTDVIPGPRRVFDGVPALAGEVGRTLGVTPWRRLEQAEVSRFADATGDRQWIHVDPDRAAAGPFGGTIAHGYYLLSLVPALLAEIFEVRGVGAVINTGVRELRFRHPVPVGALFRAAARLDALETNRRGVADLALYVEFHLEGRTDPACTALVQQMVRPPVSRPR
ncbi:MaoC family dehydratase [Actinoplanes sp. NPDC049681]|uniref:MaoC family dehydratase n=1 Tax=Actinoplanes sp. NPDC049681 TaxID=3363905 RepID=UPI00378E2F90